MNDEVMDFFMDKDPDIIHLSEALDKIDEIEICLEIIDDHYLLDCVCDLKQTIQQHLGMLVQELINVSIQQPDDND
jgi:hypothetical protein